MELTGSFSQPSEATSEVVQVLATVHCVGPGPQTGALTDDTESPEPGLFSTRLRSSLSCEEVFLQVVNLTWIKKTSQHKAQSFQVTQNNRQQENVMRAGNTKR